MKKLMFIFFFVLTMMASGQNLDATSLYSNRGGERGGTKELREAVRLYDIGMIGRSSTMLDALSKRIGATDSKAYSLLCDVVMATPGYEVEMEDFFMDHPYSFLIPEIRYRHALNVFGTGDYLKAAELFDAIEPKHISKSQRTEFLFKRAYCNLENLQLDLAKERFLQVQQLPTSDFTAPSCYALGYIAYSERDFKEALVWFEKSVKDSRFASISSWYLMECRFMMKDYMYVTEYAPGLYDMVPQERKPYLARIISESYLILGDADNAKKYLDMEDVDHPKTRSDWFHRGSVLYAIADYASAIESFNMMNQRTDSLGQIANYNLGYSYIKTRNKVAAMGAFKDAAQVTYDLKMTEDAYFNYAKLAFDLNDDSSVFEEYMLRFPELEKDDKINSYIAVAALHKKDYARAIEAYDKIDELDQDMVDNYMKANYLRARQLVENGAFRSAVPCLDASAYYAGKDTRFNQLSMYWMAESYFRDEQYGKAKEIYVNLYNKSALYNSPEAHLITYNLAYCYFMEKDYTNSSKWFDRYLDEEKVEYRKDALERKGDGYFITKQYKSAASAYSQVIADYFNVNDIYPYYQAALAYGLINNKSKKTELLENVMKASADAPFYAEALYELGRSYVGDGQDVKAFDCFRKLSTSVKDGNYVAKAYLEMGSISRNSNELDKALEYYKKVVEELPMSGHEEDALLAIENIYRAKNQSEDYVSYIETIGKGATKTEEEKEELVFSSAEQVFLSENYQKALLSLKSYLEKYPSGKNIYKANFYLAESYRALDMKEQACDCYEIVISGGEGAFVETSMLNYSVLSYKLEKWEDALGGYESLFKSAKMDENRFTAKIGVMRSAYKAKKLDKAIEYAADLEEDHRSSDALKQEAAYVMAKSYLVQSKREEAFAILKRLSADTSTSYGAEAKYMLIEDCYDQGEFEKVENMVYEFSDSASGQTYWLAKSFIILGDSFVERGDFNQAKATFESIKNGYTSTDDEVLDEVNMRLSKLQNVMNKN